MSHFRCTLTAVALLATATAAQADLLVTRDGATIETKGGWKVEGRRVVFQLPNGTLSSIGTAMVDLDRSAQATAQAVEAAAHAAEPAPPAAEPSAPVLRITEKDLPPVSDEGDGGEPAEAPKGATTAGSAPLEVVSWEKVPNTDGDSIQVVGTLRNTGSETVIAPALDVQIYGEQGGMLANSEAQVSSTALTAGASANFRVEFPGLPDFSAVHFSPSGRGYEGRPPANADDSTATEEEPSDVGSFEAPDIAPEATEPPPA